MMQGASRQRLEPREAAWPAPAPARHSAVQCTAGSKVWTDFTHKLCPLPQAVPGCSPPSHCCCWLHTNSAGMSWGPCPPPSAQACSLSLVMQEEKKAKGKSEAKLTGTNADLRALKVTEANDMLRCAADIALKLFGGSLRFYLAATRRVAELNCIKLPG